MWPWLAEMQRSIAIVEAAGREVESLLADLELPAADDGTVQAAFEAPAEATLEATDFLPSQPLAANGRTANLQGGRDTIEKHRQDVADHVPGRGVAGLSPACSPALAGGWSAGPVGAAEGSIIAALGDALEGHVA